MFRGLDHHTVACGQSRDDRFDGEQQREVPRGDDQHHAFGLQYDFRPGAQQLNRSRPAVWPHPIRQVLAHILYLLSNGKEFREPGFGFGLPQVFVQGFEQGRLVVAQAGQHGRQNLLSVFARRHRIRPVGISKSAIDLVQIRHQSLSNSLMLPTLPIMPLASYGMKTTRDLSLDVSIIFSSAST